jgi:hypothetical protein
MTESLSQPKPFDGHNPSAYMGVCYFEGKHHRIDIKHYPVEQYAFALMYFTGSDLFNRQMRMQAHNMGLLLSDHGISRKERNGQRDQRRDRNRKKQSSLNRKYSSLNFFGKEREINALSGMLHLKTYPVIISKEITSSALNFSKCRRCTNVQTTCDLFPMLEQ